MKGSSEALRGGCSLLGGQTISKQDRSLGPLREGVCSIMMFLSSSCCHCIWAQNLCCLICWAPLLRLPYLRDRSICRRCLIRLLALLSIEQGHRYLPYRILSQIFMGSSSWKGSMPTSSSQMNTPRPHQSTALPCPLLVSTSGAKYSGVPHRVQVLPLTTFAKEKSFSCRYPSAPIYRFSGLRSLYTTPRECRYSRASTTQAEQSQVSLMDSLTYLRSNEKRSPPWTNQENRQTQRSHWANPWNLEMKGCSTAESTNASFLTCSSWQALRTLCLPITFTEEREQRSFRRQALVMPWASSLRGVSKEQSPKGTLFTLIFRESRVMSFSWLIIEGLSLPDYQSVQLGRPNPFSNLQIQGSLLLGLLLLERPPFGSLGPFPPLGGPPVPDDPGVDGTRHTVLQLHVELRNDEHGIVEGDGVSDVLLGGGVDHVPDRESLDALVLGHQTATVDAHHRLDVASVLLAPSVVPSLAGHIEILYQRYQGCIIQIMECSLCYEPSVITGIAKCGHNSVCYKCVVINRLKMDNLQCVFCKATQEEVILATQVKLFEHFLLDELEIYQEGLLYADPTIKAVLDKLNGFRCPISRCAHQEQPFSSLPLLKRHLKDTHDRMYCDICLEHRSVLLEEQRLFTQQQHDRHLQQGDSDEDGHVVFRHPQCPFSLRYFYQEDQFMAHLKNHYLDCPLCLSLSQKPQVAEHKSLKYLYYRNFHSLRLHMKQSHFLCEVAQCQEELAVFETMAALEIHMATRHESYFDKKTQRFHQKYISNHNLHNMTGFYFNEQKGPKQNAVFRLKDREGMSVEDQLIRREKESKEKDNHKDEPIDLRNFIFHESDEIEQQLALCAIEPDADDLFLEDVKMFKQQALMRLSPSQLKAKLENCLPRTIIVQVHVLLIALANKQIDEHTLVTFLRQLLGSKLALHLVPLLISAQEEEQVQVRLDRAYYKQVCALPKRHNSLLTRSKTYTALFEGLAKVLQAEMVARAQTPSLNLNKIAYLERQQLLQYLEILRQTKIKEMGRLKGLVQFGVSKANIEILRSQVFLGKPCADHLQSFELKQLQQVYVYSIICLSLLRKKNVQEDIKFLSVNIYHKMLQENPFLKDLLLYKLADEEFILFKFNIYEPQPQLQELHYKLVNHLNGPTLEQVKTQPEPEEEKFPEEGISTLSSMRQQVSKKKKTGGKAVPRNTQKMIDCLGNGEVFVEKTAQQIEQQNQIYQQQLLEQQILQQQKVEQEQKNRQAKDKLEAEERERQEAKKKEEERRKEEKRQRKDELSQFMNMGHSSSSSESGRNCPISRGRRGKEEEEQGSSKKNGKKTTLIKGGFH